MSLAHCRIEVWSDRVKCALSEIRQQQQLANKEEYQVPKANVDALSIGDFIAENAEFTPPEALMCSEIQHLNGILPAAVETSLTIHNWDQA